MVSLFAGNAAQEVEAALVSAGAVGKVAVVGDARLARRLSVAGRDVLCVAESDRGLKRAGVEVVTGAADSLPLPDGSVGAVVVSGLAAPGPWEPLLAEWCRVVMPGGVVVVVDRAAAPELGRRALCGGLTAIEQRTAGRTVITAGRWHPL